MFLINIYNGNKYFLFGKLGLLRDKKKVPIFLFFISKIKKD